MGISLSGITESSTGNLTVHSAAGATILMGDATTLLSLDGSLGAGQIGILGIANSNNAIYIAPAATTATANNIWNWMQLGGGSGVTVPSGTSSHVATLNLEEPNITATGTVTVGATLRIVSAPTEGTNNYSLWVDDGAVRFDDRTFSVGGVNYEWPSSLNAGTYLKVDGSGNLSWAAATATATGSGTTGKLTKWSDGGAGSIGDSIITESSTTVTVASNLVATNLTGTLQTVAQGLITSVGTLTSLTSSGNIQSSAARPALQLKETDGSSNENWEIISNSGVFTLSSQNDAFSSASAKFTITQAGASTFSGDMAVDGNLTFTGPQTVSTSTGDLTLRAATGADVIIGDNDNILTVDGGDGKVIIDGDLDFTGPQQITTSSGALTLAPTSDVHVANAKGMVIGHTAKVTVNNSGNAGTDTSELQVLGNTWSGDESITIGGFNTTAARGPSLNFLRSKSGTVGGNTTVATNDTLGGIAWNGANGTNFHTLAATITAEVDTGTVSATSMPGRLVFKTSADGSQVPAVKMMWDASADLSFGQATTISTSSSNLTLIPTGELILGSAAGVAQMQTNGITMGLASSAPAPDNNAVHIWKGSAGSVTASATSLLVLESSGQTEMSLLGSTGSQKNIFFGEPSDTSRGAIVYYGSTDSPADTLAFLTAGYGARVYISAGAFALQGATIISTSSGTLTLDPATTLSLIVTANLNGAMTINDGTTNLYALDSRNTTPALITHYWDSPNVTLANASNAVHQLAEFGTYNVTLAGTTTVSQSQRTVNIEATQILQTGGAVAVTEAVTLRIAGAPYGATDVTITNPYALIVDAGVSRFDGNVGIGAYFSTSGITPDVPLHVADSSAGVVHATSGQYISWTQSVAAFESAGDAGISILAGAGSSAAVYFGEGVDGDKWAIGSLGGTSGDPMFFRQDNNTRILLGNDDFAFQKAYTIKTTSGVLTIDGYAGIVLQTADSGDVVINEKVGIGAAPTDIFHVTSSSNNLITAETTNSSGSALVKIKVPASGTGNPTLNFFQGIGNGSANNMGYDVGYSTSQAYFYIRSNDRNGDSGDGDVVRIADGTDDVKFLGGISTDDETPPTSGAFFGGNVGIGITPVSGTRLKVVVADGSNFSDYAVLVQNDDQTAGQGHGMRVSGSRAVSSSDVIFRVGSYADTDRDITVLGDGAITLANGGGTTKFGGNVGIGITPAYKFQVEAAVNNNWLSRIYNTGQTNAEGLLVRTADEDAGYAILSAYSGSSYKLRVMQNGQVGIGANDPDYTLDVQGTGRFDSTLSVGGTLTADYVTTSGNVELTAASGTSDGRLLFSDIGGEGTGSDYANGAATGVFITLVSNAAIAFWDMVYIDPGSSYGRVAKADADAAATGPAIGMCLQSGVSGVGSAVQVLTCGLVSNDAWSWTPGGTLYLSTTAGGITQTKPSGTNDQIQIVGIALSDNTAYIKPDLYAETVA